MATDLVPSSSTWSETNMLPAAGEQITIQHIQKIVNNTGSNRVWKDNSSKDYKIAIGSGTILDTNSDVLITFSSDKIIGASSFETSTSYRVFLTTSSNVTALSTNTPTTTTVRVARNDGLTTGNIPFVWLAVGY